ncbi:hypothetical protein MTsPCn5_06940 [Croceitalea sp. MTPC5]|uniref:hypothetical protein n=1 Tax=Croceitalea sp. MTPC5 TaxID=3056565 RepID=UPI002B38FE34|nr:hypothetical protein MTsPCn5_06940 [Croceitalea sp. MTPC5]
MTKSREISKKGFTKEVAMAALLFCLPLLISLHLLFAEYNTITFDFFGITWTHGFSADQAFGWVALTTAMSLMYLFLFYQNSKGLVKLVIQPFIWYLFYNFLSSFFPSIPEFFDQPRVVLVILSSVLLWWIAQVFRSGILKSNEYHTTSLSKNVIYALVIVLAFFIHISNEFIPQTWIEMDLGFMVVGSFGFESTELFLWALGFKLGLLLPLLVWFFMEKKWWKYALLSPILVTVYQHIAIFNTETDSLDDTEIFQALPFLVLIAVILVALSKNAKDQYIVKSVYQKTSSRIEKLLEQKNQNHINTISDTKRRLTDLKEQKTTVNINDLMEIKKRLEHELRERA